MSEATMQATGEYSGPTVTEAFDGLSVRDCDRALYALALAMVDVLTPAEFDRLIAEASAVASRAKPSEGWTVARDLLTRLKAVCEARS